jgi:hypothetical protein
VKKKNSGNSVHQRIYCHVLSISKHIRLIFVYQFCHAFKFKLLSVVYKCIDTSPEHSTLYFGAKSEKKICADHKYLQPLIILIHTRAYSYILVHTGLYSYILVHTIIQHHVLGIIRLEPLCDDVLSLLRVCCTLAPCIAHSILSF